MKNVPVIALALLVVAVVVTTLFVPGPAGTVLSIATSVAVVVCGAIGIRRLGTRAGRTISATAIVIGGLGLLAQSAVLITVLAIPA